MKTFWTNLVGALLLTAGAVFLVAAPVAAQNCMLICQRVWWVECTVTPDGAECTDGQWIWDCRWDCSIP